MARMRMVTRTVNVTNVEVMCLTVSTASVSNETFKLSGTFDSDADALKQVKKQYESADFKPTAVVKMSTEEILYGMPEDEFIKHAEILPPRKQYGNNDEE